MDDEQNEQYWPLALIVSGLSSLGCYFFLEILDKNGPPFLWKTGTALMLVGLVSYAVTNTDRFSS